MNNIKNLSYIIIIVFILLFFIDEDDNKIDVLLVNKENGLEAHYKPNDLEEINTKYAYKGKYLRREAKTSFERLAHDASLIGYNIIAVSAYRDYEYQNKLYNDYVANYGVDYANNCSAKPGYSEHQTGLAIDVSTPGANTTTFDTTDEFKWLENNAHKYGFILRYPKGKQYLTGIAYESWHYRYVGKKIAKYIHDNGITYDEYYEYFIK